MKKRVRENLRVVVRGEEGQIEGKRYRGQGKRVRGGVCVGKRNGLLRKKPTKQREKLT